jgi:hypothetical protein
MTPPNLYPILGSVLHHHYTLLLFAGALQDDVLTRRFLHSNRLFNILIPISSNNFNVPGELTLAHLALELGKVVVLCPSHNLFLHLYPNPLGQTIKMDWPSRTLTFARVKKEVLLFIVIFEADFAGVILGLSSEDEIQNILVEKRFWVLYLFLAFLGSIKQLTDVVLNSTQFKCHSRN